MSSSITFWTQSWPGTKGAHCSKASWQVSAPPISRHLLTVLEAPELLTPVGPGKAWGGFDEPPVIAGLVGRDEFSGVLPGQLRQTCVKALHIVQRLFVQLFP